jgi:hypothetical protein
MSSSDKIEIIIAQSGSQKFASILLLIYLIENVFKKKPPIKGANLGR